MSWNLKASYIETCSCGLEGETGLSTSEFSWAA